MSANWNNPTNTTVATDVLDNLKQRDLSLAKQDYASDTNIPTGAIRLNTSTRKMERYDGATWAATEPQADTDTHIADTSIHQAAIVGDIRMGFWIAAPSGYLLLQGGTIGNAASGASVWANASAANLFAHLWDNLANAQAAVSSGRGASAAADFAANKTITLPDMRQKFPIGKAASGTGSTLGGTGGSVDHTHTTPNHQHTIATHTHDMANHTHNTAAHSHTLPDHVHEVPPHLHDTQALGADIAVDSNSGAHVHDIVGREGSTSGGSTADKPLGATTSGTSDATWASSVASNQSAHTHPHSSFAGKVGNVTSGNDGDNGFDTELGGSGNTGTTSATATSTPSTNTTGGSGTLTSNSGEGGSTSGSNNPPFIAVNFIIKT